MEYKNEISLKYLNKEARICIDMDNTAETYLKRGISKEEFFEFVYQIVEMMDRCNKYNLRAEFDVDKVAVESKNVYFKTCIGNNDLNIDEIKQYLKNLAYICVFRGNDFLPVLYEYLSFLDLKQTCTLADIKKQTNIWMGHGIQENENKIVDEDIVKEKTGYISDIQDVYENSYKDKYNEQDDLEDKFSEGAETGVLDPTFWSKLMGKMTNNQENITQTETVRRTVMTQKA